MDMKGLARLGAEVRLAQIQAELQGIRRAFGLSGGSDTGSGAAPEEPKRRRRKGMSAAQRQEVSRRMKRYWAARRKANGGS